jgi:hypothetical protein
MNRMVHFNGLGRLNGYEARMSASAHSYGLDFFVGVLFSLGI